MNRKKALVLSTLFTLTWAFFILSVHMGIGWAIRGANKTEYIIDFEHIGLQLLPMGISVTLTYVFAILSAFFAFCFMFSLLAMGGLKWLSG